MLAFRNQFKQECIKQMIKLNEKKELLYKQDVKTWQFKGNMDDFTKNAPLFKKDKELAFNFMLT